MDLEELVAEDPGHPAFVDLADAYRRESKSEEALQVVLRGVSHNLTEPRGRLLLARLFYERGLIPLAVRELQALNELTPGKPFIQKLLSKFGIDFKSPAVPSTERVLAEADFDASAMGEVASVSAETRGLALNRDPSSGPTIKGRKE